MSAADEESFIILGTSPGSSLDMKYNGVVNGEQSINKAHLDEALKELSVEASMAYKAQFQLGDSPSPSSLMLASTIVSDDKTTEELQKKFGEILDENVILKETLKQNNDSMKEQFLLIASCQEDMLNTHKMHKEKFDETKELVEKLRHENKKLKQDIMKQSMEMSLTKSQMNGVNEPIDQSNSQTTSVYEFVTSPDDDTMNKLTAQLELVEKQRRQVIIENEKLTWQKESLEHLVDSTLKERDELKEKLDNIQNNGSSEEMKKRDGIIKQLEQKLSTLQSEYKTAQLRILDLENVKLEYSKLKSGLNENSKLHKEQIHDLQSRLKEAQTTVFQPVRFSISSETDSLGDGESEFSGLIANVKLYDKTLKHVSDLLNSITHNTSDGIMKTMDLVVKVQEFKLEKICAERIKAGIADVKQSLERQHSAALNNIGQIRGTLSIFEGIFKDYKELLKKNLSKPTPPSGNEALTSALLARGAEVDILKEELRKLKLQLNSTQNSQDDVGLLKAQIDIYKSDFEAERDSRQKLASDKETVLSDLRNTQKRNQELVEQLEEVRRQNPALYNAISSNMHKPLHRLAPKVPASVAGTSSVASGNQQYTCPKCMRFKSYNLDAMQIHFDDCLDDF